MTSPCWFSGVSWVFLLHTLSPRNWNYIQKNNMHVNKESGKLDSWKNGVKIFWHCPFKHMFFAPILVILFKSWIFISSIYCTLSKCHHLFLVAKMFEQYSCGGVFSTVWLFLAYILYSLFSQPLTGWQDWDPLWKRKRTLFPPYHPTPSTSPSRRPHLKKT